MEIIVSESITARLVTDKPIRKTPYQVKGVFMKQFPDEKIVPFLDGRLRSKYLYPRVQVKIINEQIYILGINEGVQSVISLLKNLKSFSFGDFLVNVDDAEVEENKDSVLLTDNLLRYKFITPWVALNAGGGSKYKRLEDNEKPLFLNKLLGQNLLFLSKELGLNISTKIFTKVEVESLEPEKVDENGWKSFNGEFKTNFMLPSFIGFGNGITRGFGSIFSLNNLETDSVRLSASTIKQLFEDTGYELNDVRKKKLVKPVALTLLPQEIKMIENTKKRKEFFIQIVLPLIIQENNNIKLDRKTLFSIINKNNNSNAEKKWLDRKYKQYGVKSNDLLTLKIRMDEIPVSLAIAQAAKETGWGTSRCAQEGNALFGQWTWSGEGLRPKEAKEGEEHKVMKFNILQASVRAYQRNLNTHSTYKDFRKARAKLRDSNKKLDSIELSKYLNKYAETGNQYVKVLQKIIKQNKLQDFDDAKLLPSSVDLESLI